MATIFEQFFLVAFAGFLGGAIGFERETEDKPAGIRTYVFVAAGAALLIQLGQESVRDMAKSDVEDHVTADPIRVIQAIIIGISFLGSGTIVTYQVSERERPGVEGLTTAAAIFFTAGVGVAVAVEHLWLASMATLFAIFVLIGCRHLEKSLGMSDRQDPGKDNAGSEEAPAS